MRAPRLASSRRTTRRSAPGSGAADQHAELAAGVAAAVGEEAALMAERAEVADRDLLHTLRVGLVREDLTQVDRSRCIDRAAGERLVHGRADLVAPAADRGAQVKAKIGRVEAGGDEVTQGDAKDAGRGSAPSGVQQGGRS